MGLFEKKQCSLCGTRIGLLDGDRRTKDGYLCRTCEQKLSPLYTLWQRDTGAQLAAQVSWREENAGRLSAFHCTHTYGTGQEKLYLDQGAGLFYVAADRKQWVKEPDVISLSGVTGCELTVTDDRTEVKYQMAGGLSLSYQPAQYSHAYTFLLHIYVNTPYFTEVPLTLNGTPVVVEPVFSVVSGQGQGQPPMQEHGGPHGPGGGPHGHGGPGPMPPHHGHDAPPPGGQPQCGGTLQGPAVNGTAVDLADVPEYTRYEKMAKELQACLLARRDAVQEEKKPVTCSHCGATAIPDAKGLCPYCGMGMAEN